MRALLIGAIACLTAGSFYGAERLTTSQADVVAREQEAITQAAIEARLTEAQASTAQEIVSLKEAEASAVAQIGSLTGTLSSLTTERDVLAASIAAVKDEAQATLADVRSAAAKAEAARAEMAEKIALLETEITGKDVELDGLRAKVGDLVAAADAKPESVSPDADLAAKVADLSETLQTRDETIAALEDAVASRNGEQSDTANAELAALNVATAQELEDAKAQIVALSASIAVRDEAISTLEIEVAEAKVARDLSQDAAPAADVQLAALDGLGAQVAELQQIVADQSGMIANLRLGFGEDEMEPMEMAEVCGTRARGILESTQINFATGTSSISPDSVATLESLRDLAIGCDSTEMVIEIGGHTDSFGSASANQALSEARATSVRDFLAGRGIPAEGMLATGFGESQPIAGNDTPAGRAANRRITFMWQMRETEPEPELETEPASVDG